ncbi:hypothetical protein GOP47_0014357 [Adiantum capillus-veneris]|uniref:Uncharacterized protein n=1 Tax=Adiantum capillus-veneris TaxID=13818 RepID=A0A9D4ZCD7_ADICA|nr:hypothetical protein GOP47_0014357 [Adiantum capillus-veneris]
MNAAHKQGAGSTLQQQLKRCREGFFASRADISREGAALRWQVRTGEHVAAFPTWVGVACRSRLLSELVPGHVYAC